MRRNNFSFLIVLTAVFFIGIFFRSYNFTPWLHFELDQARDALIIKAAIENGAGDLPLLGPRAAGTILRLGPIFYYIQYVGAKIFGNTPQGIAYPTLLFSIFSLGIFYLFTRRYFEKSMAIGLTALFSCSLFLITYSRFAWNPNMLPFFGILFFYSLLRIVDEDDKKRGWWLIISSVSLSFLGQFHFLALVAAPLIGIIFISIKRPRINFLFWIASIFLFLFLNIPMIINEIKTGGDNSVQFFSAITEKSDETPKTLPEKISENYLQHSSGYWTILTGSQDVVFFDIDFSSKEKIGFDIKCNQDCRDHLVKGMASFILLTLSIFSLIIALKTEKNITKKDFLTLNALWFSVVFVIFLPISFDLSPRFFLISAAVPFVFLGLLIGEMTRLLKINKNIVGIIFVLIFVISNIVFDMRFFRQLSLAQSENIEIGTDKILKQKTRITLKQQNEIANLMENTYKNNGYPILFNAQSEFNRSLTFLLDMRKIPRDNIEKSKVYKNANYFTVVRTQSDYDKYIRKYEKRFMIGEKKEFGTLTVYQLKQKEEFITNQNISKKSLVRDVSNYDSNKNAKRYMWREIFQK